MISTQVANWPTWHAMFTASDSNEDGVLDEAEYCAFVTKMNEDKRAQGGFVDDRTDSAIHFYHRIGNKISPMVEGISLTDWHVCMTIWIIKWDVEYKAQKLKIFQNTCEQESAATNVTE